MESPPGQEADEARPSRTATAAIGLGAYLVAAGAVVAIAAASYGFFAVTDIGYYRRVAERMALGLRPYVDFPLEYPPLAALLLALPQRLRIVSYPYGFPLEMLGWGAGTAMLVALCSAALWRGARRLVAPLAFAAGVVACGAILANRFDLAVAFAVAGALWALVRGRHDLAAALLGLGFALKLTPALLLPLVLLVARRRWTAVVAFAVAAAAPFLPYLGAPHLARLFLYHAERPLQFESVLATPFLVAHVLGLASVRIATAYGSQLVVAPGADLVAGISGPLQLSALAVTYALLLRRRASLSPEHLALATVGVLLTFLTFGKVLSPQFLIWLLPAVALTAPRYPLVAGLCLAVLALTQVEFPALFRSLIELRPVAVWVVTLRNAALVLAWGIALRELWRLPAVADPRAVSSPLPAARSTPG